MPSKFLQFPVISEGAEYLVMGYLMRRNILTYKAPPGNEGYDLICIHPDPRHHAASTELSQVRVQVKSRYASDSDRGVPVRQSKFSAFDFLVVAFLNIGDFFSGHDGTTGMREPEFYTFPLDFVRERHFHSGGWEKISLHGLDTTIAPYKNEAGFELIAQALGIPVPSRPPRADSTNMDEEGAP
jgi:hypothetical protein